MSVAFGQLALAQYDPLLADVAPRGRRGRVSGLAVALGFVGIVFAIAVVAQGIVGDGSKQRAFAPAALLYAVFAVPAFVWVRERRSERAPARLQARAGQAPRPRSSGAPPASFARTATRSSSSSAASSTRMRSRRCRRSSPCT